MKTHYTAKELAGLPGLPGHVSNVIAQAKKENWSWQKRAGRGGGKEYAVTAFPAQTQRHLAEQAVITGETIPTITQAATAPAVIEAKPLPALVSLTGHQNEIMNARVFFMRMIEAACPFGKTGKRKGICQAINDIVERIDSGDSIFVGQANLANDRKRSEGMVLSHRSLMRYWMAWQASGGNPTALAPNDGDVRRIKKETALISFVRDFNPRAASWSIPAEVPAWLPWFLNNYRKATNPSINDALRDMKRTMPEEIKLPNYHQVMRLAQKIPAVYLEKGRKTGAELNAIKGFNRRIWNEYDPFTCGQIDGHSFKAYVAHPVSGAHFHPEVCAIIDMTTKMITGYSAGLAESSRTVADAFRHSCTVNENKPVGGRHKMLEPDRGAGNMAKVNADKEIGLFARVGTMLCFPEVAGNPQGHGGIERVNQSLWIRAAKELPTYTGKDMDKVTRKKVYTRLEQDLNKAKKAGEVGKIEKTSKLLLSWREFLAALAIWVAEYNNTPHSSLPKITDEQGRRRHRSPNEELMHRIQCGWDPQDAMVDQELLDHLFMPHQNVKINRREFRLHGNRYHAYELETYHGKDMIAAYDIHNANEVYVLDLNERLICTAQWNGNDIHGVPTTKLEQADYERVENQKKLKQRQIDMIDSNRMKTVPREHAEPFRHQIELVRKKMDDEEIAKATLFILAEAPRERQYQWQQLSSRLAAGEILTLEESNFHRGWQNDPYHKAWLAMQADLLKQGAAQ